MPDPPADAYLPGKENERGRLDIHLQRKLGYLYSKAL